MRTSAQAVIIGGGVVGVSVLYHLTKLGWRDVILIERSELTSGSTWHAAGGFHTLNSDTNMAALQGYTIGLYRELEKLTGLDCGLHHVGGITLACDQDRLDMLKSERAKHRYMGLDTEIISPEEIKQRSPITNIEGVLGGLYDPLDGHLDPSGTTMAYARAARMGGAEISLRNPVLETRARPDGSWDVITREGTIHAEHVVNAAGLWAREVGALAGVYLPLHPMEHQYLITEEIAEIADRDSELPHIMDPGGESYLRQEGRGLCIGFYEHDCQSWGDDGTPADFGHELLEDRLDRIAPSVEAAYRRFPVLARAGVKRVINGPFTFAPDGNPLIGPVPGLRNYWAACAVMAGFSQAGGVGLSLAEWMTLGEPGRDVFAMDVARFGHWITPEYTHAKVRENYQRRFSISFPNEELPAARGQVKSPLYEIWDANRAVWGAQYGLEVVNYFARKGEPRFEEPSFRRSNAFEAVGEEVRNVRENVGVNELTNFGKYRLKGKGAREWLDRIMAGRIPLAGRVSLGPMLNPKGRIIGDFTISALGDEEFLLTASYGSQAYHMRWFEGQLATSTGADLSLENISNARTGLTLAGARARALLMAVVAKPEEAKALKFMHLMHDEIAGVEVLIQRLSYTGDLGYEVYCEASDLVALYHFVEAAGAGFGLRPFGMRAMMSLRLDKFFGSWMREFRPEYTPLETGLDRFIDYEKPVDWIGREAALQKREKGARRMLAAFELASNDADVNADEPIFDGDEIIGFCTSGGYSHYAGKSIALGFVPAGFDKDEVEIELLGERLKAQRLHAPLFDADGSRMRG